MKKEIMKSSFEGILKLKDTELNCYVLNDGTRLISQNAVFRAFGRGKRGIRRINDEGIKMPSFMDARNLEPFIDESLSGVISPIEFKNIQGKIISGYKAEIIPLVCDLYLKARDAKVLTQSQKIVAKTAEMLIRSFAQVGIIALVDEVTGYQYNRAKDELQVILKAYISEELLKWQKRFPDSFYIEMFRLRGWDYNVENIKKRPGVIGTWTNKLIYKQLPDGVLKELREKTPKDDKGNRKHRFHQLLTDDVGNPHLSSQITAVVTLMRASTKWRDFERLFARAFGQQELEFDEN